MTRIPQNARIADQLLEVRREADNARDREIAEGMARRHREEADYARIYAEVNFARLLQHGSAISEALRKL